MDCTFTVQAGSGERGGTGKGARKWEGNQNNPSPVQSVGDVAVTKTSCSTENEVLAEAACRAVGVLSCAELIIEDERAWQFISSHTEALLTTESEDRRIHLFNFCFKKQTSNDTTEKKEEMLSCNKISFFFNTVAAVFVFCGCV